MIEEWNKNIALIFSSSWILFLDESMSIWTSRWTCPGWVLRPRKPHQFENEYHSACCGKSGIMLSIDVVEGKKKLPQRGTLKFEAEHSKTGGLLMRLLQSYFGSGCYLVLDSGFCSLKAILALCAIGGLFAGALIKKQ